MVEARRPDLSTSYDQDTDVLYISLGKPDRRARSLEADDGLVWRTSPAGERQGVTAIGFDHLWRSRIREFVRLVAIEFGVSESVVSSQIAAAR